MPSPSSLPSFILIKALSECCNHLRKRSKSFLLLFCDHRNISVNLHNSVLLLTDITDIIACKKALKWGVQKRRERTRIRSEEKGEEGCLNPALFGGRCLGMSVDQPKKKGILN